MTEYDDAAAALGSAVLVDSSPQADALAEAVAAHVSARPVAEPRPVDPAVLAQLRRPRPAGMYGNVTLEDAKWMFQLNRPLGPTPAPTEAQP